MATARSATRTSPPTHPGAAKEFDPALPEPGQLAGIVKVVNHFVAAFQNGGDVQTAGDRLPDPRGAPGLVQDLTGVEQRLGRHACVIGALAGNQMLFDQGDPEPGLGRLTGKDLSGWPCPEDDDVKSVDAQTASAGRSGLLPGRLLL
jgi:hypothetical protein